ncbi:MAG: enoyl-CoA hydratase/carnithine racemase [Paraglaciecola sp.]|jgi:enoyl-CoA hydratase/carnithine racemase
MSDSVTFLERQTSSGKKIGHASLHRPAALNALNLDMIQLLAKQLLDWQKDPAISVVILDGSGEKAFCAGGDVVAMHTAMAQNPGTMPATLQAFFTQEYQLDHLIHTYSKPIIVWANGIVMGGGLGLLSGASHRIVTNSSRLAMPEISIGLYPDVGGSWFLNNMPPGCGLFLGLTGASINAADALYVNLADYYVGDSAKEQLLNQLENTQWSDNPDTNHAQVSLVCSEHHQGHLTTLPDGNISRYQDVITPLAAMHSAAEVANTIAKFDAADDKWLRRAKQTLEAGSPITANLVFAQLQKGQSLTLVECFQMELVLSCHCGEFGEFQEGVRALLVDKDNKPAWRYQSIEAVPEEIMVWFFASPWPESGHPLANLGK